MGRIEVNAISKFERRLQEWLDGRMSAAERRAFEAELAADPEKARMAERLKELSDSLKHLYEDVADEEVPERLLDIIRRGRKTPTEEN